MEPEEYRLPSSEEIREARRRAHDGPPMCPDTFGVLFMESLHRLCADLIRSIGCARKHRR